MVTRDLLRCSQHRRVASSTHGDPEAFPYFGSIISNWFASTPKTVLVIRHPNAIDLSSLACSV